MADVPDYYEILEVSPNASLEVIEAAYRRLARKYHPDLGGDPAQMRLLNEAYEVLRDPVKRAAYDALREQHGTAWDRDAPGSEGFPGADTQPAAPRAVSPVRAGFLSVFSLYFPVWFYRTHKVLAQSVRPDFRPLLATVALFVPIVNLYVLYSLFAAIRDFRRELDLEGPSPWWLLLGFLAVAALDRLVGGLWAVAASFALVYYVQARLNEAWFRLDGTTRTRPWDIVEILFLCLGVVIWAVVLYDALLFPVE